MRSLILLLLFSSQAFGALSIRDLDGNWSNGHEGVYDDVLDVTWLADANYAQTSGYDTNGRVDWYQAQSFASTLSIGSFDDWRLPLAVCSNGYGCSPQASELGNLFFIGLGNYQYPQVTNFNFIDAQTNQLESFSNGQENHYWMSGDYFFENGNLSIYKWFYDFNNGNPYNVDPNYNNQFAWPVHDGDIGLAPVPLPAGIYLFLSGLVGLGLIRSRRSKQL